MPVYRSPYQRGKLIIQFQVRILPCIMEKGDRSWLPAALGLLGDQSGFQRAFLSPWRWVPTLILIPLHLSLSPQVKFPEPGWLPADQLRQLQAFFPAQEEVMATEDTEEVELSEYVPQAERGRRSHAGEAYCEDSYDGTRQHVQCQTS